MALTQDQALALTDHLYAKLVRRRPEVADLDRYYRGEHKLVFASDEWAKVHQGRYKGFSDNWCGVVGSAPAERLEINAFRLGSDVEVQSSDEQALWDDWERNDGPAQSSQGFLASIVKKRSFSLVWGNSDDEPVLTWEDPSQMVVERDDMTRKITSALKSWRDDDVEFATLYTADAVWKWKRSAVGATIVNGRTESGLYVPHAATGTRWEMRQDSADDTWPLPNPLGEVPVDEWQNRPVLAGEPLSDIDGTRAMQNAINLLWAYLFSAADWASLPGRVIMGTEPPKMPILDENGVKVGEQPLDIEALKQGRLLWLTNKDAKIDQWDTAKLDVFTDVINIAIRHIAAQTRTPIYLVHGELGNVNGETMTGLDAPLVSKVRDSHKFHNSPARGLFRKMALVRGNKGVADACRTGAVGWANPEVRSDSQVSDAALKDTQIGWPFEAVLERRYGLGQAAIKRVLDQRAAEQSDPYLTALDAKAAAGGTAPSAPAVG